MSHFFQKLIPALAVLAVLVHAPSARSVKER